MPKATDEDRPAEEDSPRRGGMSRRLFLKTTTVTGVAAGIGLAADAKAQPEAPPVLDGLVPTQMKVNGIPHELSVEPRTTLLNALRNKLRLTGSKEVCDRGACGACTVEVDGTPVVSCLTLAVDMQGKSVTTVEGVANKDTLAPIQQQFIEKEGLQCGFCIPGFVVVIRNALEKNPTASLDEIKAACSGNVCRCAAYQGMFEASLAVVRGETPEPDLYALQGADLRQALESNGVPRVDGREKVTGEARYTYDVSVPGMLFARFVNCPFPQATVIKSDVDAARAVPGVRHVEIFGKEVKRIGQEVAVVVADDTQTADEAISKLALEFKPELVGRSPREQFDLSEGKPRRSRRSRNRTPEEVDKLLSEADVVVEETYEVQMLQHSPLEPHGVMAWHQGETAQVYASTQGVWFSALQYGRAAKLGRGNLELICEYMGGGFGCKIGPWMLGSKVLRLSKELGAPLHSMQTRDGLLLKGGGRVPTIAKVRLGATRDGKIVAESRKFMGTADSPYWYDIPAFSARAVRPKIPGVGPTPALRAPGSPPPQYVSESAMDDLAHALDMDPLEIRLENVGSSLGKRMKRWFAAGTERIGWSRRKRAGADKSERPRGLGVACGEYAGSESCLFLEVEVDRGTGVVRVLHAVHVFEGGFINRRAVINQVEGGTLQGLSWALFEDRVLDRASGAMLNTNHEFYKILGPADVPELEVVLIGKSGSPTGVGEAPVVPVAGALGNAIFNALGKRVGRMPFTPRNVLDAIQTS